MDVIEGVSEDIIKRARALRHEVFVIEQNVHPDEEWDGKDEQAVHFLLVDENGTDIATGRMMFLDKTAKLQRIAVSRKHRGRNLGKLLMDAMVTRARKEDGVREAYLSSQVHAIPFYEKHGFTAHGDVYDDAGIPHKDMTLIFTDTE